MQADLFTALATDPEATSVLDQEEIQETLDGDPELFRDLVGIFLEDYEDQIRAVRSAAAGRDPDALAQAAHALKGAVAMFAAHQARAVACEMEQYCRQGRLEPALELVGRLEKEMDRLLPVLRRYGTAA